MTGETLTYKYLGGGLDGETDRDGHTQDLGQGDDPTQVIRGRETYVIREAPTNRAGIDRYAVRYGLHMVEGKILFTVPTEEFATRDPTGPLIEQMTADAERAAKAAGYTPLIETAWKYPPESDGDVVDVSFTMWAYGDAQFDVPVWPASTHQLAEKFGGRPDLTWNPQ